MGKDRKNVGIRILCCCALRDCHSRRLFDNGNYEHASVAYRRAGQNRKAKICDAYLLQEKAELISTTASATRKRAFVAAANAFSTCAQNSLLKQERLTCYEAAGDCYFKACDQKSAGESYVLAELYPEAACAYQEGGLFEEMVRVITRHKHVFDDGLHEQLMMVARRHYFKVPSNCFFQTSLTTSA